MRSLLGGCRRFLAVLRKFLLENLREWGILLLALFFAPFFVFVFHLAFETAPVQYRLLLVDGDRGATATKGGLGDVLASDLAAFGQGGAGIAAAKIAVESVADAGAGAARVRKGEADLLLEIPAGFSASLAAGRKPVVIFHGDMASPRYGLLLALTYASAEAYVTAATGREAPLGIAEVSIRPESKLKPFDAAVPSLVILSILTVLFTAAALFVREAEKGTIKRLQLSRLTAFEYLAAAGLSQLLVALACVLLTLLTAMAFGYRLEASLPSLLLAAGLASASVVAFGLITAGLCGSVKDVMIVGNFPYLFMLLFSGVMPLPSPVFFSLGGRDFGLRDIFPLSHGVKALEGMMNFGLGPGDLGFELGAMALLTALWSLLGLFLFARRHLGGREASAVPG